MGYWSSAYWTVDYWPEDYWPPSLGAVGANVWIIWIQGDE